jgi:hypothetical protein
MNLSEMTKDQLIELVQQLQFSLKETRKVIQHLTSDLPTLQKIREAESHDNNIVSERLSLEQELEKHDLFKLYDYIVAADIFNGDDDITAKRNAFDTVADVLSNEGVIFNKESLYEYFPVETNT